MKPSPRSPVIVMASAPGPFFSTAPVPAGADPRLEHLINPTLEAAAAGFQVGPATEAAAQAVKALNASTLNHVVHHKDVIAPPQRASYPITVTTAGQKAPPVSRNNNTQQQHGLTVVPRLNSPASPMSPLLVSKKRPRSASLEKGVTLAVSGGFTLPPEKLKKPKCYSSASRATVRAQVIVAQHKQKEEEVKLAASESTNTDPSSSSSPVPPLGRRINSEPAMAASNSVNTQQQQQSSDYKYRKVVGGKPPLARTMSMVLGESPQTYLDRLLESRGYSTQKFCSLEGGYYCKPSPLQKASYGIAIVRAVRAGNANLLQTYMDCGLSPNPCNNFGESIVHMVCRRGDSKLLKILVDANCSLQVTDDFGRTPLHDACWTAEPAFETVEMILQADSRLLNVVDCRGSPPLAYVKKEHWKEWIGFLSKNADKYWKPRPPNQEQAPPKLSQQAPHSQTIKDPKNATSEQDAALIASGQLDPQEYLNRRLAKKKDSTENKDEEGNASTDSTELLTDETMTEASSDSETKKPKDPTTETPSQGNTSTEPTTVTTSQGSTSTDSTELLTDETMAEATDAASVSDSMTRKDELIETPSQGNSDNVTIKEQQPSPATTTTTS